jgi:hypothetical protein
VYISRVREGLKRINNYYDKSLRDGGGGLPSFGNIDALTGGEAKLVARRCGLGNSVFHRAEHNIILLLLLYLLSSALLRLRRFVLMLSARQRQQ